MPGEPAIEGAGGTGGAGGARGIAGTYGLRGRRFRSRRALAALFGACRLRRRLDDRREAVRGHLGGSQDLAVEGVTRSDGLGHRAVLRFVVGRNRAHHTAAARLESVSRLRLPRLHAPVAQDIADHQAELLEIAQRARLRSRRVTGGRPVSFAAVARDGGAHVLVHADDFAHERLDDLAVQPVAVLLHLGAHALEHLVLVVALGDARIEPLREASHTGEQRIDRRGALARIRRMRRHAFAERPRRGKQLVELAIAVRDGGARMREAFDVARYGIEGARETVRLLQRPVEDPHRRENLAHHALETIEGAALPHVSRKRLHRLRARHACRARVRSTRSLALRRQALRAALSDVHVSSVRTYRRAAPHVRIGRLRRRGVNLTSGVSAQLPQTEPFFSATHRPLRPFRVIAFARPFRRAAGNLVAHRPRVPGEPPWAPAAQALRLQPS